jgi:hypothetical protein
MVYGLCGVVNEVFRSEFYGMRYDHREDGELRKFPFAAPNVTLTLKTKEKPGVAKPLVR